jgi:hypothetical protein
MYEATLGAESRISKRVPVTSTYYRMYIVMYFISYWKSLVHHNFISKIKKSHYSVKIASPFSCGNGRCYCFFRLNIF